MCVCVFLAKKNYTDLFDSISRFKIIYFRSRRWPPPAGTSWTKSQLVLRHLHDTAEARSWRSHVRSGVSSLTSRSCCLQSRKFETCHPAGCTQALEMLDRCDERKGDQVCRRLIFCLMKMLHRTPHAKRQGETLDYTLAACELKHNQQCGK